MERFDVLIVGSGHSGAQAAIALRQNGFSGSTGMVGEEPYLPYERPPLSKEYFSGEKGFERILIRPAAFWNDRAIALLPSCRIEKVSPEVHEVETAEGRRIGYGKLIWAAGGRARRMNCAGAELNGIHVVRNRANVDAILAEVGAAQNIVVVGGGYIGLEAAAVLSKLDHPVHLIESQDRVLSRVAGETISRFYEAEHRKHGVTVRLGIGVDALDGSNGHVTGVCLTDGTKIPADLVIVGIGLIPEVSQLLSAGACGANGVEVDGRCRTSLPDVFAIGDCACHTNFYAGGEAMRLESVQNANDQASVVAKEILGVGEDYHAVPWFWSNQYDLRLQTVGLSIGHDETILRGDPTNRSFSVIYLKQGRVVALDCVNATQDYVQGRALVAEGAAIPRVTLSDAKISLKSMLG